MLIPCGDIECGFRTTLELLVLSEVESILAKNAEIGERLLAPPSLACLRHGFGWRRKKSVATMGFKKDRKLIKLDKKCLPNQPVRAFLKLLNSSKMNSQTSQMPKYQKIIEFIWMVIIIALFIFSVQIVKDGSLENQVASFGIWAPIVFVLLKISTLVIAPLSGTPLYFIGGSLFGSSYGLVLSLVGDALGSAICFLLGRFYGHRIIKTLVGKSYLEKIINTVSVLKNTKSFVKARVGLIIMPEILAYASGLSKINFLTFSLINILFYLPVDFMLVFFGSQIIAIVAKNTFLFYFLVLLVSIAGFWFLRKDYKNKNLDNIQGM